MRCFSCNVEIEDVETCPICKVDLYMEDLWGEKISIEDYLTPLEKESSRDILGEEEV